MTLSRFVCVPPAQHRLRPSPGAAAPTFSFLDCCTASCWPPRPILPHCHSPYMSFTLFETLKTRTAQTRSLLQLPAPCVPPARCALAHRLPRPCTCLLNSLPSVSGPCLGAQSLPGPPSWTCPLLDAAPPLQVASPVLHACLALPLLLLVARTEPAVLRIGPPLPSDKRKCLWQRPWAWHKGFAG